MHTNTNEIQSPRCVIRDESVSGSLHGFDGVLDKTATSSEEGGLIPGSDLIPGTGTARTDRRGVSYPTDGPGNRLFAGYPVRSQRCYRLLTSVISTSRRGPALHSFLSHPGPSG